MTVIWLLYVYPDICTYTCPHSHTHMHSHACIHVHTHVHIRMYAHTQMDSHTQTHAHTRTCTHTHMYTCFNSAYKHQKSWQCSMETIVFSPVTWGLVSESEEKTGKGENLWRKGILKKKSLLKKYKTRVRQFLGNAFYTHMEDKNPRKSHEAQEPN